MPELRNIEALEDVIVDQDVKLHALNRHIVAINDALPAEYAGWDRAKAIRDMAKKLGMKSMGDYRG